ncbi:MAG TPA: ABC transporter ATP-binding protein [Fimbriimonadaceae bacterium]|nr:ABC transporter ATP-binding protein [Fimbriimonadaceae bacterium]
MIVLDRASRWYGQVIGLNDVSAEIGPGLTALLGMNGAGKSTMLRMITGQIRPTTGNVTVFGMEPFANADVYRRIGYCPEIDNFYEHMTGRRFVYHLARLAEFGHEDARRRTEEVLHTVGMADRADRKIAGYSKGMRQRIKLAQAMLHNPDVILLDEPLNGLDPVGRHEYIQMLHQLALHGKTILVSSHILYEVEQMTSALLLLHRGRLLATGDLRVIRSFIDKHPHKIRVETTEPRRAAALLAGLPNVVSLSFAPGGEALQLEVNGPNEFYDSLMSISLAESLPIRGLSSPDNNLESVFKYLVEK